MNCSRIRILFVLTTVLKLCHCDDPASPQLCVVVKTYAAHENSLPVTLAGIFSDRETRAHMRAILVDTDEESPYPDLDGIVTKMNTLVGFDGIIASPRTSARVKSSFPRLKMNDYGYLASVRRHEYGWLLKCAIIWR